MPGYTNHDEGLEFDQMVEELYAGLRDHAHRVYGRKLQGLSMGASSLVHVALLRLQDARKVPEGPGQFVAAALQLMRYEYLDYLKARFAAKRGGGRVQKLTDADRVPGTGSPDKAVLVETMSDVLTDLETHDPLMAEVVLLSDVRQWTMDRIAAVTGVSKRTLERKKSDAHAWLRENPRFRELMPK